VDESQQDAGIDWGSAEVQDAVLTVPVAGEAPEGWAERVERTVARLTDHGGAPWEAIEIAQERIEVTGVQPGTEGDVRHVLDAAVTQSNADLAPEPDASDDDGSGNQADREMAEEFRSFADPPADD
jgi:hypothetical protein